MKNTNNPKNRQTAEQADRKESKKQVQHTATKHDREQNEKEEVSAYNFNRGYYSRNGGDKGYRGL